MCIAVYGTGASKVTDQVLTYEVQQFRRHDRARIKCQRERTYYSVSVTGGKAKRTAVAKNRRPRFEQTGPSLAGAGLSRQEISRLEVKRSIRYYNTSSWGSWYKYTGTAV